MQVRQVKTYSFNELSKEVKEKVLEQERSNMYECNLYSQFLKEDFQCTLKEKALPINDIEFSLSNCQGDGVAFYGSIELEDFLKVHNLTRFNKILNLIDHVEVCRNHLANSYSHYNTMSIEISSSVDCTKEQDNLILELENLISELIINTSKELEKHGYNYFKDIYSDKSIIENLKLNKYEFLENGNLF